MAPFSSFSCRRLVQDAVRGLIFFSVYFMLFEMPSMTTVLYKQQATSSTPVEVVASSSLGGSLAAPLTASNSSYPSGSGVGGLKVLSYSLYGPPLGSKNPCYFGGIAANAELARTFFPGWQVRVYHHDVNPNFLSNLTDKYDNVHLVDVSKDLPEWVLRTVDPSSWRFLVASDPDVEIYALRDTDSRVTERERAAVDQWLRSGKAFHLIHDHYRHTPQDSPMMAGAWGGLRRAVPEMVDLLKEYFNKDQNMNYGVDQRFLKDIVYKKTINDTLHHDSYWCQTSGGYAFPMSREEAGRPYDFVGDCYDDEHSFMLMRPALEAHHLGSVLYREDYYKMYMDCMINRQYNE